jgi:hypothetical protein
MLPIVRKYLGFVRRVRRAPGRGGTLHGGMRVKEDIQGFPYIFHDIAGTINVLVKSSRVAKIGQKIVGDRMSVANGNANAIFLRGGVAVFGGVVFAMEYPSLIHAKNEFNVRTATEV